MKLSQPVEDKNPVVLGRLVADPAKPTVVFYGEASNEGGAWCISVAEHA